WPQGSCGQTPVDLAEIFSKDRPSALSEKARAEAPRPMFSCCGYVRPQVNRKISATNRERRGRPLPPASGVPRLLKVTAPLGSQWQQCGLISYSAEATVAKQRAKPAG